MMANSKSAGSATAFSFGKNSWQIRTVNVAAVAKKIRCIAIAAGALVPKTNIHNHSGS